MAKAAEKPLLTLTEVAKRTKISMPTLQRYKKLYQDRIPSVGKGRKQRYPEEALAVFLQLKKENLGRRGRPRKNASAAAAAPKAAKKPARKAAKGKPGRKPKASKPAAKKAGDELLTLTQIQSMTGISYPTLLRYVKSHAKEIPHQGSGRSRRFKPEAVEVFKPIRSQSKRGRKPKAKTAKAAAAKPAAKRRGRGRPRKVIEAADLLARINELEKAHRQLERVIARQQKQIEKPFRVVLTRK